MKPRQALKTRLLLSLLSLLFCTFTHPARAAGFAGTAHSRTVVQTDVHAITASPVPMAGFSKTLPRFLPKVLPGFRKTSFLKRWIHQKLLRRFPELKSKADKEAFWALGLGIGGILVFPLLGPAALYLGICALEDGTTRRTEATVGIALGVIATLYLIVIAILLFGAMGWGWF